MNAESPVLSKPPGFLWIVLLGIVGFCAGFFGPLIFSPESNQGPLVGIFLTGPGGVVLGLLMFLLMKLLPLRARRQWILLSGLAVTSTLATCFFVQPEPATRGYEVEIMVERSHPPGGSADAIIADWKKRIAQVTWAAPHNGWEPQMRAALATDPGVVLETVVLRERTIKEHRKLWNRGRRFDTPWREVQEKRSYYLRADDRVLARAGSPARLFINYDSTSRITAPDIWPPLELEAFLGYSRLEAIPAEYALPP